jgi:hypothetical protein
MPFPIAELLLKPDNFFARVTGGAENFTPPILIVGIAGILDCLAGLILLLIAGDMMILLIPFMVVWALVLPYILWVIFTAVLYILSRLNSATGSFRATLQNTGYGMLPWALAHIFYLLSMIEMSWNVEYYRTAEGARAALLMGDLKIAFLVLGVLFMLWTGYLWVYGMKHTHHISRNKAALLVACFLVLYFLVTLVPTLLAYARLASIVNSLPPLP